MSRPNLEQYERACSAHARRLAGIHDLLDEDDPYDIRPLMREYHEKGVGAEAFIREYDG